MSSLPTRRALIVSCAALAEQAQRTALSWRRHHDDYPVDVIVIDDRFGEVCRLYGTSGSTGVTWHRGASYLDSAELAELLALETPNRVVAQLGPRLLATHMRAYVDDTVVLLADHMHVVGSIDTLASAAELAQGIAIVPTRPSVPDSDGRLPDAHDVARYGRFQRGIVAVAGSGVDFVDQWAQQLAPQPLDDPSRFNRVDHAWLEDLGVLYPHRIVSAPVQTVGSFRNLDVVDESLIAVLDLEGFSHDRPWQLSELAGQWPRVLLSGLPLVAENLRELSRLNLHENRQLADRQPYSRLVNGHLYDNAMRRVFRDSTRHARRHGEPFPPNPFLDPTSFISYLAEPAPQRPEVTRHLAAWGDERPDVGQMFAHDAGAFTRWAATNAVDDGIWSPPRSHSTAVNMTATATATAGVEPERFGLNVVGLLSAQLGVGEHGRLIVRGVDESTVPYSLVDDDSTVHHRDTSSLSQLGSVSELGGSRIANTFAYDVDLLIVNADLTAETLTRFGRPGAPNRRTIGVWAWETPVFPERHWGGFSHLHEVWATTQFVFDALVPAARQCGVELGLLPVQLPTVRPKPSRIALHESLRALGIDPARPLFVNMFDYFSVAERKQPWRLIEAFREAFPSESPSGPQLVIKSMNHEFFPLEREHVLHARQGRSDIVLVESYLPRDQRDALICGATAVVSLHRSEGLGLTLAEAMSFGTPVAATGWSGNCDFMTADNSELIDYELVDIPRTVAHYGGLGQWAEPSVSHAAAVLQRFLDEPEEAAQRALQASRDLHDRNTSGADARFIFERVRSLRARTPTHLSHTEGQQ